MAWEYRGVLTVEYPRRYGPPGCGKTFVVGAAATECGLRLVSVKGPELLNK